MLFLLFCATLFCATLPRLARLSNAPSHQTASQSPQTQR
ncbi:hypothetical protein VCHE25_1300 [Vibrio cholerae HE-25]|nr:hypothetical protein VCHE25_1300 [Vibrio cholerae HE-25]EMQ57063.1 hypothetical protein VCEM1676A_000293 [Vibrio cholerae O1 str. EM-1676A]